MAKADKITNEQREIVRAQNDALLRWPAERDARLKMFADLRREKALENDKIAQAKKEAGAGASEKRLIEVYGTKPQTIKILNMLAKMAAPDRSACLRQVIKSGEDEDWILPDLFDMGAVGVGTNDEPGESAAFDNTSEGQRRGGKKAQPRTTEEMAASHTPAPTPGIPLAEAEKLYEKFLAENPPKRGNTPKAVKDERDRLLAQIETAKAAEADKPISELPEAKPGEITKDLREGNAKAESHLKDMAEGKVKAEPAEKAKRARSTKAKADAAPPPPPPPADDDEDEDEAAAAAPVRPDAIGHTPATYQIS